MLARLFPDRAAFSPRALVRADAPPLLLVAAGDDDPSLLAQHRAMEEALRGAGARFEAEVKPGVGHMGLVLAIGAEDDPLADRLAKL